MREDTSSVIVHISACIYIYVYVCVYIYIYVDVDGNTFLVGEFTSLWKNNMSTLGIISGKAGRIRIFTNQFLVAIIHFGTYL